jgi:hypothetical protein
MLRRYRGGKSGTSNEKNRREYWKSRLHEQGEIPGRFTKELTHRKERRQAKKIVKEVQEE